VRLWVNLWDRNVKNKSGIFGMQLQFVYYCSQTVSCFFFLKLFPMSLSPIKSSLPLRTVLAHYGLSPLPNDRLRCPFHEDTTPSMQLYFETETVYCFSSQCPTHGKSIDVIDFVMYMENCSKGEAIAKARAHCPNSIWV